MDARAPMPYGHARCRGALIPGSGARPQALQKIGSADSIGRHIMRFNLKGMDRIARGLAKFSVERALIEREPSQKLLNLELLAAAPELLISRPGPVQAAASGDPIRKTAERKRVGIGIIVSLQHPIIVAQEKGRTARPGRKKESRATLREGRAVRRFDA